MKDADALTSEQLAALEVGDPIALPERGRQWGARRVRFGTVAKLTPTQIAVTLDGSDFVIRFNRADGRMRSTPDVDRYLVDPNGPQATAWRAWVAMDEAMDAVQARMRPKSSPEAPHAPAAILGALEHAVLTFQAAHERVRQLIEEQP